MATIPSRRSGNVINLSADKDKVLREAWHVPKPGERFAVSEVVVRGEVPAVVRRDVELWVGCIAGALEEMEYVKKLAMAGFEGIDIEPTRIYRMEDARHFSPARAWTKSHSHSLSWVMETEFWEVNPLMSPPMQRSRPGLRWLPDAAATNLAPSVTSVYRVREGSLLSVNT